MKRVFIGVPISGEVRKTVLSLFDELKVISDIKTVKLENVHFTLKYLGEVSDSELIEIKEKLIKFKFQSFKIKLGPLGDFSIGNFVKVIWLGTESAEMISLISSVQDLFDYLRKEEHAKIIPHLTLARTRENRDQSLLKDFLEKHKTENFGEMEVNKIILYESELTSKGPVYTELKVINFK